jgi:hypothetical protein
VSRGRIRRRSARPPGVRWCRRGTRSRSVHHCCTKPALWTRSSRPGDELLRPECEEQPFSPTFLNALNHTMMLRAIIGAAALRPNHVIGCFGRGHVRLRARHEVSDVWGSCGRCLSWLRLVVQFNRVADLARRTEHHIPGQVGDLTRAQPRLGREQDDHAVAQRKRTNEPAIAAQDEFCSQYPAIVRGTSSEHRAG